MSSNHEPIHERITITLDSWRLQERAANPAILAMQVRDAVEARHPGLYADPHVHIETVFEEAAAPSSTADEGRDEPLLGLATTRELLEEIEARMRITQNSIKGCDLGRLCLEALENLDSGVLNYRTVNSEADRPQREPIEEQEAPVLCALFPKQSPCGQCVESGECWGVVVKRGVSYIDFLNGRITPPAQPEVREQEATSEEGTTADFVQVGDVEPQPTVTTTYVSDGVCASPNCNCSVRCNPEPAPEPVEEGWARGAEDEARQMVAWRPPMGAYHPDILSCNIPLTLERAIRAPLEAENARLRETLEGMTAKYLSARGTAKKRSKQLNAARRALRAPDEAQEGKA